jgi:hypothetical protein
MKVPSQTYRIHTICDWDPWLFPLIFIAKEPSKRVNRTEVT